jgi:predicted DsbA family dithiol-disulfide isomerase
MKIEIWSDVACPWCYIGKRRLERALAARAAGSEGGGGMHGGEEQGGREGEAGAPGAQEVEITWRSFQLDPTAPASREESLLEILSDRYGMSPAQARQMQEQVAAVAAEEGLELRFDAVKPGNTFDAHRLVHLARAAGLQDAMKERLLRAYFTDGISVGNHDALVQAAVEVGLDAHEARATLASDRHADDVRRDQARARELGIRGVPFFLFNGELGASGAQPPEVFAQVFEQLRAAPDGALRGTS